MQTGDRIVTADMLGNDVTASDVQFSKKLSKKRKVNARANTVIDLSDGLSAMIQALTDSKRQRSEVMSVLITAQVNKTNNIVK